MRCLFLLAFGLSLWAQWGPLNPTFSGENEQSLAFDPYCMTHDCVYDQTDFLLDNHDVSQDFQNTSLDCTLAMDFVINADCWLIDGIFVKGFWQNATPTVGGELANINIYSDDSSLPGTVLYAFNNHPIADVGPITNGDLEAHFDNSVVLPAGHYWISFQLIKEVNDMTGAGLWGWTERSTATANDAAWRNPENGWSTGCTDWTYRISCIGTGPSHGSDHLFALTGYAFTGAAPAVTQSFCQGDVLQLGAKMVQDATYSWTGPNSFSSTDADPVIAMSALPTMSGTYERTVTVGGCVSPPQSFFVTVYDNLPVAISSNQPLCAGDTLNLSTPDVSGATYTWSGPNGFSSNLREPSISNVSTVNQGTYTCTITREGCQSQLASHNVTVHSLAAPMITSNLPVCEMGTLSLSTPAITGATYTWSGPNGFSSNVRNPSITNVSDLNEGMYSLVVMVDGCTKATATLNVVIGIGTGPDTPVPSGDSPCEGGDLHLTVAEVMGATYSWTGPNGQMSSDREPTFTNVDMTYDGTWQVFLTAGSCSSPIGETTITIRQQPIVPTASNDGPVCLNSPLTLTATGTPGSTFTWSGPNGFSEVGQMVVIDPFTAADQGDYTVSADISGCAAGPSAPTTATALFFEATAPISQAQGLGTISLLAENQCPQGSLTVEWFNDDTNTSFGVGVNPLVLDPPLTQPVRFRVEQSDDDTTLTHYLTVLANPAAYDLNGDLINNLNDLFLLCPHWPGGTTYDFDGTGKTDIRDFLFIRTSP
ncbi:MAG: immunoglobulin domain-containing protein [Acidobacteria bacterium]|nr:immunoglobulin domain-containing protein [Acidobacteriota bacterium]